MRLSCVGGCAASRRPRSSALRRQRQRYVMQGLDRGGWEWECVWGGRLVGRVEVGEGRERRERGGGDG